MYNDYVIYKIRKGREYFVRQGGGMTCRRTLALAFPSARAAYAWASARGPRLALWHVGRRLGDE